MLKKQIEELKGISRSLTYSFGCMADKDGKIYPPKPDDTETVDTMNKNLQALGTFIDDAEKPTYTVTENLVEELGCEKMALEELLKNWDDMISNPEAYPKESLQGIVKDFAETLEAILLAKN